MKDINVRELRLFYTSLQHAGAAHMSFDDFVQSRLNELRDDWHMYRPVVEKLERSVTELQEKVNKLEGLL